MNRLPPQALHYIVRIEIHGMLDCLISTRRWQKVVNCNFLVLIFLVIFKETADLSQTVRRELIDISVVSVLRIISTNCNYLVIFLSLC